MPVESAADRASLLADFGGPVSWTVGEADPVTLMALEFAGTVMIDQGDGPQVRNSRATLLVRAADVPVGAEAEDAISFRGRDCVVVSIEPDGEGMAVVRVEEAL